MNKYQPIIGLEVHVQLKTQSKMFCGCSCDYREDPPNTHCCPVCLGLPGALPVPNKKAIEEVLLMGLSLNCKINTQSYFARKNYFYPDLSKGYQITQYDKPFCYEGSLTLVGEDGSKSQAIGITRIHLEEDTGKSIHVKKGSEEYTLLDFNKSGIPLMELVTEPDFHDAETVWLFAKRIRQIVRYLGISDGDMEKGQLRVEPNISVKRVSEEGLPPYKVEIKNLNSFSALKHGVEFEIERQIKILEAGEIPTQETRGWNEDTQETFSQRSKEEAHDYRYFPEPDIPPIEIQETQEEAKIKDTEIQGYKEAGIYLDKIKEQLVELPDQKIERFIKEYGIPLYDAEIVTEEISLADWFEKAGSVNRKIAKKVANWIISELLGNTVYQEKGLNGLALKPEQLVEVVELVEKNEISRNSGREIISQLIKTTGNVQTIIKEKGLQKISDDSALESIVVKIIADNPKPVEQYKEGKTQTIQFLIGMVMKETQGKADVGKVKKLFEEKLQ